MNHHRQAKTIRIVGSVLETSLVGEMGTVAISLYMLEKLIACLLTAMGQVEQSEKLKEDTVHKKFIRHLLESIMENKVYQKWSFYIILTYLIVFFIYIS